MKLQRERPFGGIEPLRPPTHAATRTRCEQASLGALANQGEVPLFATEGLTSAQLNGKLLEACYNQVFAQSEESLKAP